MKVLAWLAFPLAATLLAMCWAAWRGWRNREPRRSGGPFASVDEFRRFNAALAAPGPSATPERRRGFGRRVHQQAPADARTQQTAGGGFSTEIRGPQVTTGSKQASKQDGKQPGNQPLAAEAAARAVAGEPVLPTEVRGSGSGTTEIAGQGS
ncbi:hypothetical protein [Kribbella solani]|uniref:Uncharacterized protein n=1 Tax=Kribbella solani TaxID=236067 RepID=A0A841DYF8_9ACTN|nr:hypothetical protein [Kribbella solani]MBB5983692.1 hypothetical protein [Kribbella solani]